MDKFKLFSVVAFVFLLAIPMMSSAETLPEKCRLTPVNGSCKAMMDKYYFDQKTGQCSVYIYDGCGSVVPFNTLDECRVLCETVNSNGNLVEPPEIKSSDENQSGPKCDPVEDDPRYAEVFKTIDDEVKDLLATHPQRGHRGFVHIYWGTKKSLFKQKYGIDWCSPSEMNPYVIYD